MSGKLLAHSANTRRTPHSLWLATAIFLVALLLAWTLRFIQDDAFISFRYAENLAMGHGLVWNPGERTEGYTNFLWTLLMAIPMKAGWDPVQFAFLAGITFFAVTLGLTYRLGILLFGDTPIALTAIGLLGANYSFIRYATGGLETSMQTCAIVTAAFLLVKSMDRNDWPTRRLLALSLVFAVMLMIRLDSAIFVVPFYLVAVAKILRTSVQGKHARSLACLTLPGALMIGPWLLWKIGYYGDVLPNTFYLKTAGTSPIRGLYYIAAFVALYGLFIASIPLIRAVKRWSLHVRSSMIHCLRLLAGCVGLWLIYVISVGGDFMEFRMLIPVLPFTFLFVAEAVWHGVRSTERRVLLLLALLLFNGVCVGVGIAAGKIQGILSVGDLSRKASRWRTIGEELSRAFPPESGVRIATTAAGAIPFYSKLTSVDLLGLNDAWVARNGLPIPPSTPWLGNWPGHTRIAPLAYVKRRGVHLLLNHPWFKSQTEPDRKEYLLSELAEWPAFHVAIDQLSDAPEARVVEWPLGGRKRLVMVYLMPHPEVDAALRARGAKIFPLQMTLTP